VDNTSGTYKKPARDLYTNTGERNYTHMSEAASNVIYTLETNANTISNTVVVNDSTSLADVITGRTADSSLDSPGNTYIHTWTTAGHATSTTNFTTVDALGQSYSLTDTVSSLSGGFENVTERFNNTAKTVTGPFNYIDTFNRPVEGTNTVLVSEQGAETVTGHYEKTEIATSPYYDSHRPIIRDSDEYVTETVSRQYHESVTVTNPGHGTKYPTGLYNDTEFTTSSYSSTETSSPTNPYYSTTNAISRHYYNETTTISMSYDGQYGETHDDEQDTENISYAGSVRSFPSFPSYNGTVIGHATATTAEQFERYIYSTLPTTVVGSDRYLSSKMDEHLSFSIATLTAAVDRGNLSGNQSSEAWLHDDDVISAYWARIPYAHAYWRQFDIEHVPVAYHYVIAVWVTLFGIFGILGNGTVLWMFFRLATFLHIIFLN